MTADESVTTWLARLQAGDLAAADPLLQRYFDRLVILARGHLSQRLRRVADEEDIALSAFDSFCRAAAEGRFPRLDNRNDLWRLLLTITVRKACGQVRHEDRQSRGAGAVVIEGDLFETAGDLDDLAGSEPDPQIAAAFAEEVERLLAALPDALSRQAVVARLEGCSVAEIAERLGCSFRAAERKLAIVRKIWLELVDDG